MMFSILVSLFCLSIVFLWRMVKLSQNSRLNQSGRYEYHISERREARRRKRSRERAERAKKVE
jgi:hypothetical protein